MNKIIELDKENMTLTVEPGVLLLDIAPYVEAEGLYYPPDPGEKSATIGGNISTNAGGMRAVKYGVTRDYVRALEVVLPNGEVTNFGGKVVKDSSGYDLKDLIIGSEGTLGIVTKAILKLIPLPEKNISLLIPFPRLKDAIDAVPEILQAKVIPTAVEFLDKGLIECTEEYLGCDFPDNNHKAYLLLKFDATTDEEITAYCDIASKIALEHGAEDILLSNTGEREESLWKPRGAFFEAVKNSTTELDEVDIVVPRACINEMLEFIVELSEKVDIKAFGHAGDGNLHTYILRNDLNDEEWEKTLKEMLDKLFKKGYELGGLVSGEHGIGYARKEHFLKYTPKVNIELMKKIKAVFDPKNILNPGKIF
eukprot:TRINITY_DN3386_c0_g2_i1.p1 TRINITY_DN3386_c0_g2~~TRINITY_DN3386_c0_g2_i1.p1  ORF type:complete len:366 (+),score=-17.86 TRINITY_DN3386_c0_g2_i1:110-1207(+)